MSKSLTPKKPGRRTRPGASCILPLLLFACLAADFNPNLFAQAKTPEAIAEAKRAQLRRQRLLADKRKLLANPERDVSPSLPGLPAFPADRLELLTQAFEASESILIESEILLESQRRWKSGEISKKEARTAVRDSNRRLKQQVKLLRRNQLLQWIDWSPQTRPIPKEPLPDGTPSELAAILKTTSQRYHERITRLRDSEVTTIRLNDLKEPGLIESASRLKKLSAKIAKQVKQ